MQYNLRGSQPQAVQKGLEVLRDKKGRKEVIVASTAYGKSLIISCISKELTDGKVLVLSPSTELLEQNVSKLESFGVYPAVYSASVRRRELDKDIIYATPKSVSYEILKDVGIKYVIIDECDFSTQEDSHISDLLKSLKIKSLLGLTATPFYMHKGSEGTEVKIMTQVRGSLFKDICFVNQIQEMVQNKYWSDLQYFDFTEDDGNTLRLNDTELEYMEDSIDTFYEKFNIESRVKELLLRIPKNESVLIFVSGIKNCEKLSQSIEGSAFVHSKMKGKDRKEVIDKFKNGELKVLVNSQVLLTGFDAPIITTILDILPTNSIRTQIQKTGRGIRIMEGKKFCRVLDLVGNFKRFGDVRDLNFEYIDGYGWGFFKGDILLTDVPQSFIGQTTKSSLKRYKKPLKEYRFGEHNPGDAIIDFGQFKNNPKNVMELYIKKRHYLKWLAFSDFQFKDKELERQVKTIWNVPYEQH